MAQYHWNHAPSFTIRQVENFVQGTEILLSDCLVGIYLHGSLAMGCFNIRASDIDLLVVVDTALDLEMRRKIATFLLKASKNPHAVEISYIVKDNLVNWRHPLPYEFHYGEDHRALFADQIATGVWQTWRTGIQTDYDLAAHVTVTRLRGITLYGASHEGLFPDVPEEDYRDSLRCDLKFSLKHIEAHPVYAILNMCRMLYYLEDSRVSSKQEGGEWALARVPEHHEIISQALADYRDGKKDTVYNAQVVENFVTTFKKLLHNL